VSVAAIIAAHFVVTGAGSGLTFTAPTVHTATFTQSNTGTTTAVTLPATILADDWIFLIPMDQFSVSGIPSGFSTLRGQWGSNLLASVYVKKAVSGDAGATATFTFSGTGPGEIACVVVRNGRGVIRNVRFFNANANTSTFTLATAVTSLASDLLLYLGGIRTTAATTIGQSTGTTDATDTVSQVRAIAGHATASGVDSNQTWTSTVTAGTSPGEIGLIIAIDGDTTATQNYELEVLADSPIAYWKGGEASGVGFGDRSGIHGFGGLYAGSPTLGATALISGDTSTAVTYNGTSQYALTDDQPEFDSGGFNTVESWIKTTATTGAPIFVARDSGVNSSASGRSFQLGLNLGKPYVTAFIAASLPAFTGTVVTITGPTSIADGNRHQVAFTYDGTTLILYVDGTAVASTTSAGFLALSWQLSIGCRWTSSATAASLTAATIGHVSYYGTALSAARILAHYNAGLGTP
jgi:hypothetical protein